MVGHQAETRRSPRRFPGLRAAWRECLGRVGMDRHLAAVRERIRNGAMQLRTLPRLWSMRQINTRRNNP